MENLRFTVRIFKEDAAFVAHVPELDVSSCGDTEAEAQRNIRDAVSGFLETAKEMGTLKDVLEESGYRFENGRWREPELVGVENSASASICPTPVFAHSPRTISVILSF